MKRLVLIAGIFISYLLSSAAQGYDLSFPSLKGYKTVNSYPVYTPDDLWNYIDGAADAYLALGFIDLHITEYVKGKQIIKAELYRFGDDTRAFGMYALERSPDYRFVQAGVQGYNEEGVVNFYKGNYYVKIMTQSQSPKANEAMLALAGQIAGVIKGKNEFPAILKMFPAEGKIANQEIYILESVLGHDYLRGAYRASYEVDGDRFDIYIIDALSTADAAAVVSKLTGNPPSETAEADKYAFEDGYNGTLYLVRKGNRFVILSGLDREKAQLAEHFLEQVIKQIR